MAAQVKTDWNDVLKMYNSVIYQHQEDCIPGMEKIDLDDEKNWNLADYIIRLSGFFVPYSVVRREVAKMKI